MYETVARLRDNGNIQFVLRFAEFGIPISDIAITIIGSDSLVANYPSLVGVSRGIVRCLTSQFARAFENNYSERYLVLTNSIFTETRRNLFLIPVTDVDSGFGYNILISKVERIQQYFGITP